MALGWLIGCVALDVAVIISNIIEQVLIMKKWQYLDRIDHLLFSLSISDLVSGLATLGIDSWFLARENGHINESLSEYHPMVSKIFDSVFLFSVFASIFHVIAVAIERLYAIRFPRKYYIFTTLKCKCITVSIIWSSALILTPTFSVLSVFSYDRKIGVFIRASVFLSACFVVLLTYMIIAYLLVKQRKSIIQDFSPDCGVQEGRLKRLTVLCLFLGISFVICTMPITLAYLNPALYHPFSNIMITLNSFINPCVYFMKVYYDSRNITRNRSETNHALLDTRSYAYTVTTESNGDSSDVNENGN